MKFKRIEPSEAAIISVILFILLVLVCGLNCSKPIHKNTCKKMELTKYQSMKIEQYPDTIRILVNKNKEKETIGKFLNLGYRVYTIRDIIKETYFDNWKQERYIVFVRQEKIVRNKND